MLLSYDELDNPPAERNDDEWAFFGEPNVYPQFAIRNVVTLNEAYEVRYYSSNIYYYELTEPGKDRQFFREYISSEMLFCEEDDYSVGFGVRTYHYPNETPGIWQKKDGDLQYLKYHGVPLYDELCQPLAALDGPWNEHDFVKDGSLPAW